MLKQEHALHSKSVDALIEDEELQHILIPACELGIERYREFRAAKPNWRPRSYGHAGGQNGNESTKMCEGCRECVSIKKAIQINQIKPQLMVDCSGLSKASRPISISFSKPAQHARVPVAEIAASCQALQSLYVGKATQNHANKGGAAEEAAASKPQLVLPTGSEVSMAEDKEQMTKPKSGEGHSEPADSRRIKVSELAVAPAALSEQATSSEDLSDDTMTPPHMEATSFSDHAAQGDSSAVAKGTSKYTNDTLTRVEEPILVDNQGLFDFVVATRKIPYGHSFSNLDLTMQKKLHDHFKLSCPPCPHCNCNTFVKFRYFNNSGKSSLLQPRYTCRNPDTCLTVQEKSGKAGSRDFTLPRPREAETYKPLPGVVNHQRGNGLQGRAIRQPQMIPRVGSKRSVHDLGSPSEAGERSAKLPNTTLSLQTLNGSVPVVDMANLQIVDSSKARSVHFVKPAEDSNSSSSTQTASDEQTGINVRYRTETSSENGVLVVKQPISVHTVAATPGTGETGTVDARVSKGGKIAEVNICMYIDLSAASSC